MAGQDQHTPLPRHPNNVPPLPALLPNPPTPPIPFKRLTPVEMIEKREKGLCYNCDEKFHLNHVCKGKLFALLIDNPDSPEDTTQSPPSDPPIPDSPLRPLHSPQPEISYHALDGQLTPHTFRILGDINNHPVQVLIDSGSTHNFIQQRLVEFLQLPIQATDAFHVLVGNGDKLHCSHKCAGIQLKLQRHIFALDSFVIPLQGADIVLGVQWLQQLGNITTNYTTLTMSFLYNDQLITLHGNHSIPVNQIHYSQLLKLSSQGSIASYFTLSAPSPITQPSPPLLSSPPEITSLLDQYSSLFSLPISLPPDRTEDHQKSSTPSNSTHKCPPLPLPTLPKIHHRTISF